MSKNNLEIPPGTEPPDQRPESFHKIVTSEPRAKKTKKQKIAEKAKATRNRELSSKEKAKLDAMLIKHQGKTEADEAYMKYIRERLQIGPADPLPAGIFRKPSKFTLEKQQLFCMEYAKHNRASQAAKAVGVTYHTVMNYRKSNPIFAEMYAEAEKIYSDHIREAVYKRAVSGYDEPIIGGKDRDQIVGYKKVYSDRLLELEAKKVDQGYRERGGVEINTGGGVLVVSEKQASEEDWSKKFEGLAEGDESAAMVIEGEKTDSPA